MYIKDDINSIENLKLFIEKWAGKQLPKYGLSQEEVPEFLPKPLREIYLFAGNWPNIREDYEHDPMGRKQPYIFQNQDILMGVENLERENGRISFLMENQSNWTCEVEENNDDSPVYSDAAVVWDENASGHEIVCKSLSHFLVTFCLQELVYSSKYVGTINDKSKRELILKNAEPIWLNGIYVDKEPDRSFHIFDNKILIMDGYWYGCNDERALELLKDSSY